MGRRIGRLVDSKLAVKTGPGVGRRQVGRWVNFFFEKNCQMVVRIISYFCLFDGS